MEAFANFRRVRIPRAQGAQRLSAANARFKHMRNTTAQHQSIAAGTGSVYGRTDWVWGFDPVVEWDKMPTVPELYAA